MNTRDISLLAALAASLLTACGDETPATDAPSLDAFEEKVVRGELTRERPEVGSISMGCTATLVAPDVGLTAAHCVNFGTREQPGSYGTFTLEPAAGGQRRFTIERYKSYLSGDLGPADLALFRLSSPVPADVARPAPLAPTYPGSGASLTVFGYGCTQRNTGTDWRKRKATFPMGQNTNHLCPGDSGGPVFDDATGAVLRVNSGYYLDGFGTDIFGDVARYHATLRAQVEAWSSGPLPEAGAPGGGAGDAEVCGFHRPTRQGWTCSADGAARERCRKGHAPEREACAAGCEATVGVEAACQDAAQTRACGAEYAPYVQWTCTADGGHVLRCAGGQVEVSACFGGCDPGAWHDPAGCR